MSAPKIRRKISFWRIVIDRNVFIFHSIAHHASDAYGTQYCEERKHLMDPMNPTLPADDDQTSLPEPTDMELPAPDEKELPSGENSENEEETVPPIGLELTKDAGNSLMALQGLVNRQTERMDSLREDIKRLNESLKSIIENDAELTVVEDQLKEVNRQVKERKQQLSQSPETVQLKFKVKEIREQIKELEESLNNNLLAYYQMTGTKVFDTNAGGQREFRITAKVLAKKNQPSS